MSIVFIPVGNCVYICRLYLSLLVTGIEAEVSWSSNRSKWQELLDLTSLHKPDNYVDGDDDYHDENDDHDDNDHNDDHDGDDCLHLMIIRTSRSSKNSPPQAKMSISRVSIWCQDTPRPPQTFMESLVIIYSGD